jgi:hypothetical protein
VAFCPPGQCFGARITLPKARLIVDLRDKEIQIRFDRFHPSRIVVYYKNNRLGDAKKLDLIANGLIRRGPAIKEVQS